jgi:hypothetical protein
LKNLKLKKFICLLLVLGFCVSLVGCGAEANSEEKKLINEPLKEVHAVYDIYNNLIQQTVFNEQTGEYITTIYTYEHIDGLWTCTNQSITVLNKNTSKETIDELMTIYNLSDLEKNPITLLDSENIKISLIECLDENDWRAFGYKVKLENKTNKTLVVILDNNYIMNIKCSPVFSVEYVEASKTQYFELSWDKETLERRYIPYIDNIEFMLRIYDNENWKVPALEGTHVFLKY